ncbi:ATP-binding protein [Fluviispira multicolorata]|nr:ATP-binding protein [Fluviispira multicolorata]
MQNNYSLEAYKRLVEVASSINVYERVEKSKYFAAEIWECSPCIARDFPLWHTNTSSLYESVKFTFNFGFQKKYPTVIIYNDFLIISVEFPIYSYKINSDKVSKKKKYTLKFYKKTLDFSFIKQDSSFLQAFFILNFYIYLILLAVLPFPIYLFKRRIEVNTARDIASQTLENVKNMIEHELINQENILKYPSDFDTTIQAVMHHNKVAQITLKSVLIENLNPLDVLQDVWNGIGNDKIKLTCTLSLKNKLKFDKTTLYLVFNTILKNATHESLKTHKIHVDIKQHNSFGNYKKIIFKIKNDGKLIEKKDREKIFQGYSTKKEGHGIGLKNLKEILKKSGSDLVLSKQENTCFIFELGASDQKFVISKSLTIHCMFEKEIPIEKSLSSENLPWVVVLEDNEMIWRGWEKRMSDAKIFFFKTPNEFFYFIDEEKMSERPFLSKIKAIISDFDFGNGINFINSNLIGGIENEEEKFTGKLILCTGFNEKIQENIPFVMREKIDLFFQKKHISYFELNSMFSEQNK